MLDGGSLIPALHLDEAGLLDGLLVVALADGGVLEDVVGVGFVELGRAVLHGVQYVQYEGVLLILHFDGPECLGGGHLVLRHHRGDVVAVEADPLGQYQPVGHILMALVGGPGMSGGGEVVLLLQVKAGKDFDHAGDGFRRGSVDGLDPAVCDGGVQYLGHIGALVAQIVGIFGAPDDLVIGVHTGGFLSYIHGAFLLSVS